MRDLPRDHQLLRLNKWADLDPAALAATRTLTAASKHAIGQVLPLLPGLRKWIPGIVSLPRCVSLGGAITVWLASPASCLGAASQAIG